MKCIYILFSLVLIISFGIGEGELPSVPFYTRLEITQDNPGLNEEFTLTHSLIALVNLPETRVIFEIPKGIELIEGQPIQNFNPSVNDSVPHSMNLKITHPRLILHNLSYSCCSARYNILTPAFCKGYIHSKYCRYGYTSRNSYRWSLL